MEIVCRSIDYVKLNATKSGCLIRVGSDTSPREVPAVVEAFLARSWIFRPLMQHYQLFTKNNPQCDVMVLSAWIPRLMSEGFMISHQSVVIECISKQKSQTDLSAGARLRTVGIPTRNRVAGLERCLNSLIENSEHYSHNIDILVADDSDEVRTQNLIREKLIAIEKKHRVRAFYAGKTDRESFAEKLIALQVAPPEVIRFALLDSENSGFTAANNRNAIALHMVGEPYLTFDDDTIPQTYIREETKGIRICSGADPNSFWTFPSHADAMKSVSAKLVDIISLHRAVLGKNVGQCLTEFTKGSNLSSQNQAIFFDPMSPDLLRMTRTNQNRVLITWMGFLGDNGMSHPTLYYALQGPQRDTWLLNESTYTEGIKNRQIHRAPPFLTLAESEYCQTTAAAFENTDLLPPFPPGPRGAEGFYGLIYRICFSEGLIGYLPESILHSPLQPRTSAREDIWRTAEFTTFPANLGRCLRTFLPGSDLTDGAQRMRALGKHVMNIGSMSLDQLESFLFEQLRQDTTGFSNYLGQELARADGKPDCWAKDINKFIAGAQKSLAQPMVVIPIDIVRPNVEEVREANRMFIFRIGQLIHYWPEIVAGAKDLRQKGTRLATPISR